ncbi:MAG: CUAEP/CCAEP-tail radical SAM protein [Acidimicrobiia bacterium]|nr:CUAEP/CCAEP-tail radical SAM protein [Acidimicrobiia bacterium]
MPVKALLISTYELGHQPLHVASPAAVLRSDGHDVRAGDLAVDPIDWDDVEWADAVAISVPMHTAMRLAVDVASRIKARFSDKPICLYGLYAGMSQGTTLGRVADRIIVGEYETALASWANTLDSGVSRELIKSTFLLPARDLLPPLDRYAKLESAGQERIVGYVEASHGCRHRCGHCPIPAIYDGLFRVVGADVVLDDIAQLVGMGAEHITFGDPDFFNGPHHAMRILEEAHRQFPDLTFDITVKVEHILKHRTLWGRVRAAGVVFAVSAFESMNDDILAILDKGHDRQDMAEAVEIMRSVGIDIRPSWLPFTPWTTAEDVVEMFRFVAEYDLPTDPIQFTIKLLIPEGSVLLKRPELTPYLGVYDHDRLTYEWVAIDSRAGKLVSRYCEHVDHSMRSNVDPSDLIRDLFAMALEAAELPPEPLEIGSFEGRPRLTEPWFC